MKKILIVGGGLVGSLLAVMMKKRGHHVEIFEKRTDPRLNKNTSGRSINLIVTSRGLHALKSVGLYEEALKLTVAVTGRMMHSKKGELTYQAYGRDPSECNYSISRSDLNNFLLERAEALDIPIHFNKTLTNIDLQKKQASFQNETTSYDVLFGTDGAGSETRALLKRKLEHFEESVEFLSAGYKELFMPLDPAGLPQLRKDALHIWPRGSHMLMALPNLDGSFTMTLYLSHKGAAPSFETLSDRKAVLNYFTENFADAVPLMPDILQEFEENPEGKLGTVRSGPWVYQDSVAILGDASHAIVPFFGQGMNSGFEDCTSLANFLDESGENFEKAFKNFQAWQPKQANAIADMALENFIEMSEKVGDENFLKRKKCESYLEQHFPTKYRARYGMITYTLIPYAIAQEIGLVQDEILTELLKGVGAVEEIDLKLAGKLIDEKITPLARRYDLSFEKYNP